MILFVRKINGSRKEAVFFEYLSAKSYSSTVVSSGEEGLGVFNAVNFSGKIVARNSLSGVQDLKMRLKTGVTIKDAAMQTTPMKGLLPIPALSTFPTDEPGAS